MPPIRFTTERMDKARRLNQELAQVYIEAANLMAGPRSISNIPDGCCDAIGMIVGGSLYATAIDRLMALFDDDETSTCGYLWPFVGYSESHEQHDGESIEVTPRIIALCWLSLEAQSGE